MPSYRRSKPAPPPEAGGFRVVRELLAELALLRGRYGFPPRETAQYVLSLKGAISPLLERELADEPQVLYQEILAANRVLDGLSMFAIEALMQGRRRHPAAER